MKRFAFIAVLCILATSVDVLSANYYTQVSGLWTSNIWGTTTTGVGGAFPTLQNGDILYIDDDVTLVGSFPIDVQITIVVSARLTFSNPPPAQLSLVASSEVHLFSGGELIPQGEGNSNFITIGGNKVYEGMKTGEIQGPGTIDGGGWKPGVLPVRLTHFDVDNQASTVILSWATSIEEDFRSFIVQRSRDGLHFEDIGEVNGKGFNIYDIESRYSYVDEAPFIGFNYYRLKAVDLDDSFEHFGVKVVKISAPKKMTVYPNPSSGESIIFRPNFSPRESDRIVIIDQLGIELFNAAASAMMSGVSFPERLRPGIYLLRYVSDDFEQTARIVVKN